MGCLCQKQRTAPIEEIEYVKENLNVPVIWLLGVQGTEMDEQVKRIKHRYKLHDLSPATVIKKEIDSMSKRGRKMAALIMKGKLPNESVLMDMYRTEIKKFMNETNGFYMAHFPLTLDQGEFFEDLVAPAGLILFFHCHKSVLKERLLCGRVEDPRDSTLDHKIRMSYVKIIRVLQHYEDRIFKVDSNGSPSEVFEIVRERIDMLYNESNYLAKHPFRDSKFEEDMC